MENEKKEQKNNKGIVILLLVLLIGSIGMNFFLWSSKNKEITVIQNKVDTLVVNNTNLEVDVKSKVAELEVFRGKNDSLNHVIDQGVAKIQGMESEIAVLKKQSKGNSAKKKELEAKIAELDKLTEEYLERIDQLVTENKLLKKENDDLTTNLTAANSDKANLQDKVNTASVLRTEYVKVTPMKKKLINGKLEETAIAKKVVKFNADFSVMDNKVAPAGKKTVYLRIVAPDGKVIGGPEASSGKFKNAKGEDLQFTTSKDIDYTGAKTDLNMEYNETSKAMFVPGNYTVEIYVDGNLTSTVGVALK